MKKLYLLILFILFSVFSNAQGVDCSNADPFCTNTSYLFPASTNVPSLGQVGCLITTPNPAWYWMQVGNSGNLDIHISSGGDVDFICWGPFSSLSAACASNLMSNSGVDCSYSTAAEEDCNIVNAQTGQIYVLLITNYANISTNISFNQTGGTGTADCGIIAPPVTNNGPLCAGQTLNLTVTNPTPGATYNWTGPCGFVSNVMNPTIPNIGVNCGGAYNLTITVGSQVSPPVTTTVVVNPIPVISASANPTSICAGASSILTANGGSTYLWNNGSTLNPLTVSPITTTTYTVTGTSLGCSNTASVVVNVNPVPNISINASINPICSGGSTILTAIGGTSYLWSDGSTSNPLTVSPIITTTYTVTGTSLGCNSTASITIVVNPSINISINASINPICSGGSTILTAIGGTTYLWGDGSTFNPLTVTPTTTTTYTVTGTSSGCSNTASIIVNVDPTPVVVLSALPNPICAGGQVTITASGSNTYLWNDGSTLNPLIINPLTTGTYSVTGTDASSCTDTESIVITVGNGNITSTINSTNISCYGYNDGIATLNVSNGNPPYLYNWSNTSISTVINNLSPGNYTVTITDSYNCSATDNVIITEPTILSYTKVVVDESCFNSCNGSISITTTGGTIPYSYLWNSSQTTSTISNLCFGNYIVNISDANGCSFKDTSNVATLLTINAEFTATPDIANLNDVIQFNSTGTNSPNQTYYWDFGDNSNSSNQNPEHYYTTSGDMDVTLFITVDGMCTDSVTHRVKINCPTAYFIPNCFTPNGDGQNEVFKVKGYGFDDFKLRIFNRWGEQLILLDNIEQSWDGTFNGEICPQSTYFYIFESTGCDGKYYTSKGVVVLLR